MKRILYLLLFALLPGTLLAQGAHGTGSRANRYKPVTDTTNVTKQLGRTYVYDSKFWIANGTYLVEQHSAGTPSAGYMQTVDSTLHAIDSYFSRSAGVDTSAAHMTLINTKLNWGDSTSVSEGSYRSGKAVTDSLSDHMTLINTKVNLADSTADTEGSYASRKALSDSLTAHWSEIALKVFLADSSLDTDGSYASRKALSDTASAHWTEIGLKADDADVLKKDGTVAATADLDIGGNYLLDNQNTANLGRAGQSYHTNGITQYVNMDGVAAELVATGNSTGSIIWGGMFHDLTTDNQRIWYFGDSDAVERIGLAVSTTDYKLGGICAVAGVNKWSWASDDSFNENTEYSIVFEQNGTTPALYVNGKESPITFSISTDLTAWFDQATGIDNGKLSAGAYATSFAGSFANVDVNYFGTFNTVLSGQEKQDLYTTARSPNKYVGASNAAEYTGDFSADVNGWTQNTGDADLQLSAPVTQDAVTETMKIYANGGDKTCQLDRDASILVSGKAYRLTFDYFAETSSGIASFGIGVASNRSPGLDGTFTSNAITVVENAWQTGQTLEFVNSTNRPNLDFCTYTSSVGQMVDVLLTGKSFYLKNVVLTRIGEVVGFYPENMTPTTWYGTNDITGTVSGATLINSPVVTYQSGRALAIQGTDIASANDITLGDGNYFDITGTTIINRILGTGWTAGSQVTLQFDASVTVDHGTAAGSNYYGFKLSGAGDMSATADDTLTLVFDGAWWREVARTVI